MQTQDKVWVAGRTIADTGCEVGAPCWGTWVPIPLMAVMGPACITAGTLWFLSAANWPHGTQEVGLVPSTAARLQSLGRSSRVLGQWAASLGDKEAQAAQWAQCPASPGSTLALTITPASARGDEAPLWAWSPRGCVGPLRFSRTPFCHSPFSWSHLFLPLLDHPRSWAPPRKTNTSSHLGAHTPATSHPTRKPASTGF